ncbi:hypothetical protein NMY22_g16152 [Coprinellus aureogranulatus]|nr:hypothetical protein NMY22_g16152 [Coprinellus aureogranulatus]
MQLPLIFLVLLAPPVLALLRFPCAQLKPQRDDRSQLTAFQVSGGNAFESIAEPNTDLPSTSTCTTCRFKEDFSNYWTANLYFKHENGSYTLVPQMPAQFTGSPDGGTLVYYVQPNATPRILVSAPPKGFSMAVARTKTPVDPDTFEGRAISFRCYGLNYTSDPDFPHPATGPSDTLQAMPPTPCTGGIRAQIFFPSCWDGVNLQLPAEGIGHTSYPDGPMPRDGPFWAGNDTSCPVTHPARLPLIYYEVVWNTTKFNNMWPEEGGQPFVLASGAQTNNMDAGFVSGWKEGNLQVALNNCTDVGGVPQGCRPLTTATDQQMNSCSLKP